MSPTLFRCRGGEVVLPSRDLVLVSRLDGGNLVILPPMEVWERSELTPDELTQWSFLIAATGRAMLEVLPQLEGAPPRKPQSTGNPEQWRKPPCASYFTSLFRP